MTLDTNTPQPATRDQIVHSFLRARRAKFGGWGVESWNVEGTDTYINNCLVTIDQDYVMGYVIEAVDSTSSVVSYLAIATFHGWGWGGDPDKIDHDSEMYEGEVGTFFEREMWHEEAAVWGVHKCFGLFDAWFDRQATEAWEFRAGYLPE